MLKNIEKGLLWINLTLNLGFFRGTLVIEGIFYGILDGMVRSLSLGLLIIEENKLHIPFIGPKLLKSGKK